MIELAEVLTNDASTRPLDGPAWISAVDVDTSLHCHPAARYLKNGRKDGFAPSVVSRTRRSCRPACDSSLHRCTGIVRHGAAGACSIHTYIVDTTLVTAQRRIEFAQISPTRSDRTSLSTCEDT